eukprot:CAMPEP_0119047602 /NCGR_PEP_ID=MMETSP1177-20130426/54104_1 /TAXON_ID=2985 /ORGANISM="Ochromonas sp, Strain CCMP1899" /LENGTH=493 /DNA_ID=CAMNT_0007022403 /DNA_START=334 /DNA_END=1811 /DNA_ORIENTATION=+
MKKLKEKKVYLIEYNSQQAIIDELKTKKTQHLKELKDKDTTLDELYLGQRKLKTASKIGCNASDMIEHNFTVPSEKLSQIIGKAGATLLKIEMDCKVSIDTKESKQDKENKQGNVRIIGTSDTVALAVAAVLSIVSSLSLEVSAIDEKLVCLLLNKAQFAHEIESKYDVRIDISRAKKVFKVVGQPDAVHAAVKEIEDANSARIEIPIEVSILPFIVGKGGSTIKALGEGNQVHIDVEREEKLIVVIGFLENVEKSVVILKNIINENSEIEITIMADKSMIIGCIIGSGGQVIRSLQKDFSVNIRIDRDEDGKQDSVIIKGATSKAIPAKAKVMALIAEYEATTEKINVSDDLVSIIVGKKWANISKLRERFPDALIEIDVKTVKIQSSNVSTRQAVRAEIEEIVTANYMCSVDIDSDTGISMKGARGNDVRVALSDLNVQFDISPEINVVKLRGLKENVLKGIECIESFKDTSYFLEIPCHEDDFSTIFNLG